MKTNIFLISFLFLLSSGLWAQPVTKTFQVSGNCGMCKKTIESAATTAGASSVSWDNKSKMLTVSFDAASTSILKIQTSIADAGYDNEGVKASDAAYDKLHACCQYDRNNETAGAACCVKDGKCKGGKPCCKKSANKECCKDGKCDKEGGCCADCKSKQAGCCNGKPKKQCKGKCEDHR